MKKIIYTILPLPLMMIPLGALFFIFIMLNSFELNYLQAKIENSLPGYEEIGILVLIFPAYYLFSLIAFLIMGLAIDFFAKKLDLDSYKDEIWDILIYWCPFVLVLGVVLFRFISNPSLSFMNTIDWIGFAIVAVIHIRIVFSKKTN